MRYNYSDPTANTAIANILREQRRKERLLKAKEARGADRPARREERGGKKRGAQAHKLRLPRKFPSGAFCMR